jgi:hypothetical protein
VPELRLDNPALYGELVAGSTLWTKFDPEGLATPEGEAYMRKNHPVLGAFMHLIHGALSAIADPFGMVSNSPASPGLPQPRDFNPAGALINDDGHGNFSPNYEGIGGMATGLAMLKFGGRIGGVESEGVSAEVGACRRAARSEAVIAEKPNLGESVTADAPKTYYRLGDTVETMQKVIDSGELWGRAPKNIFSSDIDKVKAWGEGTLPEDQYGNGFEFKTTTPPDKNGVPGKPTWSGNRPGVVNEDGWAKIKIEVTKDTITPTTPKEADKK